MAEWTSQPSFSEDLPERGVRPPIVLDQQEPRSLGRPVLAVARIVIGSEPARIINGRST